jgi:aminoglycoside 6'-N-acetyltransferase
MVGRSGARHSDHRGAHRRSRNRPLHRELWQSPIGYQQCWDPHAEPDHPCRDQPAGTRGIDQFIGEPDFLGYGHGSAFIRRFVEQLFAAGAPRVVTDPNPRNARAIRAYTKAGFRPIDTRLTISGQALLMACDIYTS